MYAGLPSFNKGSVQSSCTRHSLHLPAHSNRARMPLRSVASQRSTLATGYALPLINVITLPLVPGAMNPSLPFRASRIPILPVPWCPNLRNKVESTGQGARFSVQFDGKRTRSRFRANSERTNPLAGEHARCAAFVYVSFIRRPTAGRPAERRGSRGSAD